MVTMAFRTCKEKDREIEKALKQRESIVDDKTVLNSQSTHFFSFSYLFMLIIELKMILLNSSRDNYIYIQHNIHSGRVWVSNVALSMWFKLNRNDGEKKCSQYQ